MRLLNVNTLKLEEHFQQTPYAILSHRWRDGEEVLYQDIADSGLVKALQTAKKSGYDKIIATCHQAKLAGIPYIWVDTCCIDKSNSAELSEEINSMYRYYQDAHVCYAFLNGLFLDADIGSDDKFAGHAWFERGWTLQELIAPREVIFFTDQVQGENPWACLGQRSGMCEKLSDITGIDADVLTGETQPRLISVAKRMSWAARRMTTRIEDTAYCLMGLFGVNMPMLYGEGENAFVRLHEEIMKDSSDETLFAWRLGDVTASRRHGLLAPSPAAFKNSGGFPEYIDWEPRDPFFKTNRGLRITLPLRYVKDNVYVASLNRPSPRGSTGFAGFYLEKLDSDNINDAKYPNQFARVESGKILSIEDAADRGSPIRIYVRQSVGQELPRPVYPEHIVQLYNGPHPGLKYTLHATMGHNSNMALKPTTTSWIPKDIKTAFKVPKKKNSLAAVVVFKRKDGLSYFTILLGAKSDYGDVRAQVIDDTDENCTFAKWQRKFSQDAWQSAGTLVDLGPDQVRVDIVERIATPRKYFVVSIHVEEHESRMDVALDLLWMSSKQEPANPLVLMTSNDPQSKKSKEAENAVQVHSGIKSLFKRKNLQAEEGRIRVNGG